ncbi:hypothetical protein BD413DRAFT_599143 [Trametes elegans]|nr:hypothetical protein BD413DRAFT_599143 [Trametes elegans]
MENRLCKRDVWRKVQAGELSAVPDVASEHDEEITLMDSPIQESGESPVSHVQRFLRTLTAWYTACNALFYTVRQVTSFSLFSFHTGAFCSIPMKDILAFRKSYWTYAKTRSAALDQSSAAKDKINLFLDSLLPKRELNVVTHAEAGLMALVLDQQSRHAVVKLPMSDGDLNALFSASGRIDIGVSKKCCYCCDILANLIHISTQGGLTFSLPGTHGTIFPWNPPPFGINTEQLQQMRDKLFKKFHDIVTKRILDLASTQSLPVSVHGALPEEQWVDGWFDKIKVSGGGSGAEQGEVVLVNNGKEL